MIEEFEKYKSVISENGREALKQTIVSFRKTYGENWLKEFQAANPAFSEIVSLAANFNAESAFVRLQQIVESKIDSSFESDFARIGNKFLAKSFLDSHRAEVFQLHAELSEVINRTQF